MEKPGKHVAVACTSQNNLVHARQHKPLWHHEYATYYYYQAYNKQHRGHLFYSVTTGQNKKYATNNSFNMVSGQSDIPDIKNEIRSGIHLMEIIQNARQNSKNVKIASGNIVLSTEPSQNKSK